MGSKRSQTGAQGTCRPCSLSGLDRSANGRKSRKLVITVIKPDMEKVERAAQLPNPSRNLKKRRPSQKGRSKVRVIKRGGAIGASVSIEKIPCQE